MDEIKKNMDDVKYIQIPNKPLICVSFKMLLLRIDDVRYGKLFSYGER